ncbi:MAG TPA: enoyl-CoA hydratase/isomerase family protein [Streptosporangiaceae bacterium]|nr:enoyl-CoA hydratase/isomerase family protein [Streptosporangiaceae bacterium]
MADRALTGPVQVRCLSGHAEVRLADIEGGNPLGPGLVEQVLDAVDAAERDPGCRALIISAAGPYFCRGLDLGNVPRGWLADPAEMPVWKLFERLRTARVVTAALVDGQAVGGGVALAAACDLVIAGEPALFRFTEGLLGLVPGMALPFVADRVGQQVAFRMALTACEVGAEEAARIGLVDVVRERAADGARPVLVGLRRMTPDTVRALKALRARLYPKPGWMGEEAARASLERLAEPGVAAHLDRLRAAGLLR